MFPGDLLIVPSRGMRARTPGDQDIVIFILSLNIMYWFREKHGSTDLMSRRKSKIHSFFCLLSLTPQSWWNAAEPSCQQPPWQLKVSKKEKKLSIFFLSTNQWGRAALSKFIFGNRAKTVVSIYQSISTSQPQSDQGAGLHKIEATVI